MVKETVLKTVGFARTGSNPVVIALPIAQLAERRIVVVLDTKREELDAPRAILSHVFP